MCCKKYVSVFADALQPDLLFTCVNMALIAESQTAFHDPNAITLLIEVISAMIARY